MSGFSIEFSPWRTFQARKKPEVIRSWLKRVGDASVDAFKGGMGEYPPASDPGAWPNRRSSRLYASVRSVATASSVTVGTSMRYSKFLREGTSRMARRKMSNSALAEGVKSSRLGKWVEWSRG